ncbi:helix-turn-helix transcriptional regulator [Piscinibacter sakaiensis]|uniref:helix-turn-helix domain-containing protein n=1 Tax=Piscinibacter sakaiensis TaxID=1547922 RepID=UPI0009E8DC85|nr:helix-turn-helix transcriptional regulator [Piscinibacter sakaiensis]
MKVLTDAQIGLAIKAARQAAHMTAKDFAEKTDLSPTALSKIEAGRQCLSLAEAVRVAHELGIRVDHLVRLADDLGVHAEASSNAREKLKRDLKLAHDQAVLAAISMGKS